MSGLSRPGGARRRRGPTLALLSVLSVLSLLTVAGCSSTVDGRPIPGPGAGATEPSVPTPRRPPPVLPPPSTTPPEAEVLTPDENGYVFVEAESDGVRCQISADSVGCEAEFTDSPIRDGHNANGVNVDTDGTVEWVLGNLGAIPAVPIGPGTYTAQGWTIVADADGTRFTSDRTGHGMFVSIDNVETF